MWEVELVGVGVPRWISSLYTTANPILACVLWMSLRFDLLTDGIECVCVSVWCVYYRCCRSTSRTEDNPPSTNWLQSIWFAYQQRSYPVSRTSLYDFCGYQLHPCKVRYRKTILCTDVLPALAPSTEANHMNSCLPFNTCIKHSLIGVSIYVYINIQILDTMSSKGVDG